jgi:PAS domain S-box-containing protein
MKDKTKEKLLKELLVIQQKYEALKGSLDLAINELNNATKWSETLLSSLPHPAMYIRANDMVIMSANRVATDMGVKIGGYCWREFMKADYLSQKDKEIAAKYPDKVPAESDIKCSFCLRDKCFSDSHEQINHEMNAFGLIWETYWIKVSEEVFLHYAIDITKRKQAEKELLESENRNREIIDNSLAGYFYINLDGLFQKVNSAWLRLHKYDNADEVIGKHFAITQVDIDLDDAKKIVEEILQQDQIPSGEFSRLCKDGSIGYHTFSCNKVMKDGKVIGLEGFIIDTTERKKVEEKLLFINKAIESSSNAIGISDAHGHHFYQNKAFTDLFGYSTAGEMEAAGGIKVATKDPEVAKEKIGTIMTGKSWSGELEMVTKSGHVFPAFERTDIIKDLKGNIIGLIGEITDISERKQSENALKESEKKYRHVVENVGEGIGFVNSDEEFEVANPAAERIFGVGKGELIGKNLKGFLSEDQYLTILNQTKTRKKGHESTYEFELTRPDGKKRSVLITAVPQFDDNNKFSGTHGIFRDITEQKRAELILKESGQRLLQLNADKDRFISILSHDLKSPFINILGFSEILTDEIESLNKDDIKEIAKNINKSAKITNNLLEDILLWARTQQGKILFNPQKLSFTEICKDTIEVLKPSAKAKNITLNYDKTERINVFADIDMLKTILRNLISNAIKFTNNDGAIRIIAEQTQSNIIITVSDNGVGISHDNIKKLFDIGQVLTTKGTAKETGTGLGLLLCKEFVQKNGGKIWVESKVGIGSEFRFTLPVSSE